MTFRFEEERGYWANIKVMGVGGGGSNAVDRMVSAGVQGMEFIAVNTDAQALKASKATRKVQIGTNTTEGLGAGSDPEIGRVAAEEDRDALREAVEGANMVFITAGMGGGTGTGGIPVIAEITREMGILTVAIVTKPFAFEGRKRRMQSDSGMAQLQGKVDTLVAIPNDCLLKLAGEHVSFMDAFRIADDVLYHGVKGVSDLINIRGLINLDFADVRTIMKDAGDALMGMGSASGEGRALTAVQEAVNSPLLRDISIDGAKRVLLNITGGPDFKMSEAEEAASFVHKKVGDDANIIFGVVMDESLKDTVNVTVIASGFEKRVASEPEEGAELDLTDYASQSVDRPAIRRRGIIDQYDAQLSRERKPIPPNNLEIPAFLRNKML